MRLIPVMAGLVALLVAGCSDGPSADDCNALLDKIIELEISSAGADKLPAAMKADVDKQRAQLKEFLGERFLEQCQKNTPPEVIACGLKAKTKAEYAACEKQ